MREQSRMQRPRIAALVVVLTLGVMACGGSGDGAESTSAPSPEPESGADGPTEAVDGAEATAPDDAGSTETASGEAPACDPITVGVLDDDPRRALFHGLQEGLTDSEVEIELNLLTIPALIEAAQSGTFDIVEASAQIPVLARQGGVDMRVLAPASADLEMAQVLLASADFEGPQALAGGTLGVVSLGSTTTLLSQIVLGDTYGLDPAVEGGDVTFIELPFDQVASEIGRSVDAGTVSHYGQWLALKDPNLTAATNIGEDYRAVSGDVPMPLSVFMTTGPQLEGRGECFDAARRAIDASFSYAVDNAEEVAAAIAQTTSAPDPADVEEFLPVWLTEWMQFDVTGDEAGLEPVTTFWNLASEQGLLPPPPAFDEIAVRGDE